MSTLSVVPAGRTSNSKRAGLLYPTGRIHRILKKRYAGRVTQSAAVYTAGVLEYLTREITDVAGEAAACAGKKHCITSRSIYVGIRNDNELTRLYHSLGMIIPGGGVLPAVLKADNAF